eukprot:scaffold1418_cov114-Isochrysis_galbana.AAC.5
MAGERRRHELSAAPCSAMASASRMETGIALPLLHRSPPRATCPLLANQANLRSPLPSAAERSLVRAPPSAAWPLPPAPTPLRLT